MSITCKTVFQNDHVSDQGFGVKRLWWLSRLPRVQEGCLKKHVSKIKIFIFFYFLFLRTFVIG